MHKIIALVGPAGCGKSTVAAMLAAQGFAVVKFADPLKDMLRGLGLAEAQIEGAEKEGPCSLLGGKSPRYAMQTLGTEWGRGLIAQDIWVSAWLDRAWAAHRTRPVVADDCRFRNEAAAVRVLGGQIWRIIGRGGIDGDHASETEMAGITADVALDNSGTLDALRHRVIAVLGGAA